ncbi:MAG: hypothetical protein P8Q14_09425, partial [Vicingaceae bacterium]|nr:hypothetical protein [Vicingaceae bacterium]
SGILKDTIIIGVIGLLLFTFSEIFIYKKKMMLNILISIIGIFILQFFRPILLFVLIPSLFFWALLYLTDSIKVKLVKIITRIGTVISIVAIGWFINHNATSETSKYKIDNLMKTLHGFQSFHSMKQFSEGQNIYTLGGIMKTPKEVVMSIPSAVNVTLFRPYLWEINNIGMFLAALESLLLLLLFLYVFFLSRKYLLKVLFYNKEVIFMITFSLAYAFIVGVSSYNFGALSRYKVPAIMFFLLAIIIIYNSDPSNSLSKAGKREFI